MTAIIATLCLIPVAIASVLVGAVVWFFDQLTGTRK